MRKVCCDAERRGEGVVDTLEVPEPPNIAEWSGVG